MRRIRSALIGISILLIGQAAWALTDTTVFVPAGDSKRNVLIADAPHPGGDAATINLLAVYTPRFEAQIAAQGHGIADFLLRTYAEVNRFFANTGLATRIRLAGLKRWDLPAGEPIQQDNDRLVQMIESGGWRDAFAADLIQLWEVTEAGIDDPQICGWGQAIGPQRLISSQGFGYSTVARGQVGTDYAGCYADSAPEEMALLAAHEIGHNLGSTHAWGESEGEGAFEFARGQLCGRERNGYPQGTIMSTYGFRLPYFSTPERRQDGQACGAPIGSPYPADNRETFTRTAAVIAGLRPRLEAAGAMTIEMPARIGERNGSLPLVLSRSEAASPASVEILLLPESARPERDYLAPAEQQVRFAAGQYQVTVTIPLQVDGAYESQESLVVWVQEPQGLELSGGRAFRVQIADRLLVRLGDVAGDVLGDVARALPLPGSEMPDADPRSVRIDVQDQGSGPQPGGSGAPGLGLVAVLLMLSASRISGLACRTAGRMSAAGVWSRLPAAR